ncbi:Hypothetical protein FKW44_003285 [Caligus rogercresseyi]|uniref:Uncharacterized protein n=1 Tax=Caligus rogercresseyi TaxID=217165 RepID=A0A7T8KLD5_CALRO|nr:Hypothetical protein FKW44_003285 [Caligus rogercresseyi]
MSELPDLDNAQDNEESTATAGAVSPCIHHHTSASGSLASAADGDLPSAPGGNTGKNTEEDVGRRLRGGVKKGEAAPRAPEAP